MTSCWFRAASSAAPAMDALGSPARVRRRLARRPGAGSFRSYPNRCDHPSGTLRLLITLAGLPAAREFGGTSRLTTEWAAITDPAPTVTPGRTVTLPPSHTLSPMTVGPL